MTVVVTSLLATLVSHVLDKLSLDMRSESCYKFQSLCVSVVKHYVWLNEGRSAKIDLEPVPHSAKASALLCSLLRIFVDIFYLFWKQSSAESL